MEAEGYKTQKFQSMVPRVPNDIKCAKSGAL